MRNRPQSEHLIYEQIAMYMKLQYPDVIYRFDLAADLKLTPGQATRHKRIHPFRGYPDLFIAEPVPEYDSEGRIIGHGYSGLYLEIKKEGTRLRKKDGAWASEHIAEQAEMLNKLRARGYAAEFTVGFDGAKTIIDDYLKGGK